MQAAIEFINFYNAERLFKYHLTHNPYFPFLQTQPKVFVLLDESRRHIVIVVVACLAIVVYVVLVATWRVAMLLLIIVPAMLACVSVPALLCRSGRRILVFDGNSREYEYYDSGVMTYKGHCHNLYIRLKVETGGTEDERYYSVVVNGYGVREYAVTSVSQKKDRLYKMARKLASNLNLNFFDCTDISTNHVVRHVCPHAVSFFDYKYRACQHHCDI